MALILVAGNHPQRRELLHCALTEAGHEVRLARDADETRAVLSGLKPDALLLDTALPGQDGFAVLHALRQNPATAALPVVLLTSRLSDPAHVHRRLNHDADCLFKPITSAELLAKLNWVLARSGPAPLVLLADDEPKIRKPAARALEAAGLRVVTAADGREALDRILELPPDLVVLDVMMPRMDGFEVLKELKANPATASLPVIMLTALYADSNLFGSWASGVDYYLTKPFNPPGLAGCVVRILRGEAMPANLERTLPAGVR